jgi:hypothetical protein
MTKQDISMIAVFMQRRQVHAAEMRQFKTSDLKQKIASLQGYLQKISEVVNDLPSDVLRAALDADVDGELSWALKQLRDAYEHASTFESSRASIRD